MQKQTSAKFAFEKNSVIWVDQLKNNFEQFLIKYEPVSKLL